MTTPDDRFGEAEHAELEQAARPKHEQLTRTFADAYSVEDFDRDLARPLVRLDKLPHGWGIGERMNRLLGGGVGPGYFLAIGAASAGGGKSAWTLQLADGLAARTAELVAAGRMDEPLTPVVVLSEMSSRVILQRSLARFCDVDSRILRAGRMATEVVEVEGKLVKASEVERVRNEARAALASGPFADSRRFIREWRDTRMRGDKLSRELVEVVRGIRGDFPGRDVWPVVVLDPIQRWADAAVGEVEGMNELVESIGQAARDEGWVVIATSDTNANAARGNGQDTKKADRQQSAAAMLRGSYQLIHEVDAALVLQRKDNELAAFAFKNRNGTHLPDPAAGALYDFTPTRMRLTPRIHKTDAEARAALDAFESKRSGGSKSGGRDDVKARQAGDDDDEDDSR